MASSNSRIMIAALALSAVGFVSIIGQEGYSERAIIPVPGDVPTIGFGTTEGVKPGDTITPPRAVNRAMRDVQKFEGALKQCVKVQLFQYEFDAYVSLSYNIGPRAFCASTLVKRLNEERYGDACLEILKWDKFKGRPLRGLTNRRQAEYRMCRGEDEGQ